MGEFYHRLILFHVIVLVELVIKKKIEACHTLLGGLKQCWMTDKKKERLCSCNIPSLTNKELSSFSGKVVQLFCKRMELDE